MEIFIYIKINYNSKLKLCTIESSFPASADANRATLRDNENPSLSRQAYLTPQAYISAVL